MKGEDNVPPSLPERVNIEELRQQVGMNIDTEMGSDGQHEYQSSAVTDHENFEYSRYLADNRDDDLEIFRIVFQLYDVQDQGMMKLDDLVQIAEMYLNQDSAKVFELVRQVKEQNQQENKDLF